MLAYKFKQKGFSLIEVLVVISIISILTALIIPSLSVVRERARRIGCMSNIRQCIMICNAYGSDNDGYLPLGNIWGDQGKEEGWLDVNYEMVNNLYKRYGATEEIGLCKSWQFEKEKYFYEPPYVDDFNFRVGGTRLGYIYYGGRFDQAGSAYSPLKKDGSVYKSPRRVMDSGKKSIGSSTLLSCFHWDSINAGGNWGAKIPHAGSGGRGIYMQPDSKKVTPEPRGLVIGYMDNSSEWVKWDRLDWFEQGGKIRIYFSER